MIWDWVRLGSDLSSQDPSELSSQDPTPEDPESEHIQSSASLDLAIRTSEDPCSEDQIDLRLG